MEILTLIELILPIPHNLDRLVFLLQNYKKVKRTLSKVLTKEWHKYLVLAPDAIIYKTLDTITQYTINAESDHRLVSRRYLKFHFSFFK